MKRSSSPVAGLIAVFLLLSTVHTAEGQVFGTDTLRIRGSGGVASRIHLYADDFMKANPDKRVVVVGGETKKGIDIFLEGNAEVLMTSRRLTEEEQKRAKEKGMELAEHQSRISLSNRRPRYFPGSSPTGNRSAERMRQFN